MEKLKKLEEKMERKKEAITLLKEQYDTAIEEKRMKIIEDIQRDIAFAEKDLIIEKMRNKLVQEEA